MEKPNTDHYPNNQKWNVGIDEIRDENRQKDFNDTFLFKYPINYTAGKKSNQKILKMIAMRCIRRAMGESVSFMLTDNAVFLLLFWIWGRMVLNFTGQSFFLCDS